MSNISSRDTVTTAERGQASTVEARCDCELAPASHSILERDQIEQHSAEAERALKWVRVSGPVAESERIVPMDVLRGFALLGILVM